MTGAQIIAATDGIADDLQRLGAVYDASREYPARSMALLADAGLLKCFAPVAAGGVEWTGSDALHQTMFDVLRRIGRADLSIGRLFEGHLNAMLLFDWFGDRDQQAWLARRLASGAVFGVWASEPVPGVRLVASGDTRVLKGGKHFASGAGGIDHAIITAQPEDGSRRLVIIDAGDTARTDNSRWLVRGMRATASGNYDLTDVDVRPLDLLGQPGDYDLEPRFTAGAWRFCAVQLGGIEGLLQAMHAGLGADIADDPVRKARAADAIVAGRTAYLWVREAVRRVCDADNDAVSFVLMTRGVVERAALDVMEIAARLLGTRSAVDGQRADKIIRDLSLYLRQAGPDYARGRAADAWLDHDCWGSDRLW